MGGHGAGRVWGEGVALEVTFSTEIIERQVAQLWSMMDAAGCVIVALIAWCCGLHTFWRTASMLQRGQAALLTAKHPSLPTFQKIHSQHNPSANQSANQTSEPHT